MWTVEMHTTRKTLKWNFHAILIDRCMRICVVWAERRLASPSIRTRKDFGLWTTTHMVKAMSPTSWHLTQFFTTTIGINKNFNWKYDFMRGTTMRGTEPLKIQSRYLKLHFSLEFRWSKCINILESSLPHRKTLSLRNVITDHAWSNLSSLKNFGFDVDPWSWSFQKGLIWSLKCLLNHHAWTNAMIERIHDSSKFHLSEFHDLWCAL